MWARVSQASACCPTGSLPPEIYRSLRNKLQKGLAKGHLQEERKGALTCPLVPLSKAGPGSGSTPLSHGTGLQLS